MAKKAVTVRPDFELSITNGVSAVIFCAGIFVDTDGVVDFGLGWDGSTDIAGICALLDATAVAVQSASFTGIFEQESEDK